MKGYYGHKMSDNAVMACEGKERPMSKFLRRHAGEIGEGGRVMGNKLDKAAPAEAGMPGMGGLSAAECAECQKAVETIRKKLAEVKKDYLEIGRYLNLIKEKKWYLREGDRNIFQFAERKFQLPKSEASRIMNLHAEFSAGNGSAELDGKYKAFSLSLLKEMLPMNQEQREAVTPGMTVRQIREMKRKLNRKADPAGAAPEGAGQCPRADLPVFRNDAERKQWVENPEGWGLWYEDKNIGARYYKHDFPDGSRLIAAKYRYACPAYMKSRPSEYKENIEADGSYCGRASFRMTYADWYWDRHGDECRKNDRKFFANSSAGVAELVKFLKELAIWETERSGKTEGAYISNEYVMQEFDPDHPERARTAVCYKYGEFFKKKGYIPRFFNAKNCKELTGFADTLTTSCGERNGIGSILFFDAPSEIALIVNNEEIGENEAAELVRKVLRVAEPGERERAEKLLAARPEGRGAA